MSYTERVEQLPEGRNIGWAEVAREYRSFPANTWRKLKIDNDSRCKRHMAACTLKKLRDQGLPADKREHFDERANVPDPQDPGKYLTVRDPLGLISLYAMWVAAEAKPSETPGSAA